MITKNTTHPQQQKETQMNKKAWLDTLYYDLGHQWTNFWTTSTWLKNGEPIFTKWKTYLEVQENEELWSTINQRSLLINEIVLEYDGGWPAYVRHTWSSRLILQKTTEQNTYIYSLKKSSQRNPNKPEKNIG